MSDINKITAKQSGDWADPKTWQSGKRDVCQYCKSEILPGQTGYPREYCCGTIVYKNLYHHQSALCAAWQELAKLRAVAEASKNALLWNTDESIHYLKTVLEAAGYLKPLTPPAAVGTEIAPE